MAEIDLQNLSQEITDKYSVDNNAFKLDTIKNAELDLYTGEPKDEINVIVGDDKQPDKVYPQVKLERWTNEVNFSVRLIDNQIGTETVSTDKDKIIWDKGNVKIEMYDFMEGEGGYKFVWYLKEKPLTNKVEFTIQSKGLDFFYQPELTAEEIAQGASRPENVVGSYAVYHSTKGGMNDINGKEYKTGKAFHIYRPHIIDAEGKETWGNLHIENGIYSVEIPQEFLDKAVYPIKSNDTFGFTSKGGGYTSRGGYADEWVGSVFTSPSGDNVINNIVTAKCMHSVGQTGNLKGTIVLHSNLSIISGGVGGESDQVTDNCNVPTVWRTSSYSSPPSITASTAYVLSCVQGNNTGGDYANIHFDAGDTDQGHADSTNSYSSPTNPTDASHQNNKYSIYATYTSSGGSSASPSASPSVSPSVSPSQSVSPSVSLSISPSYSPSVSPSISQSASPSASHSESFSPSYSPSISPSFSPGWGWYTKGDYDELPANDDDLENEYTEQEYEDVGTKDDTRVGQTATNEYAIHQFKDYVGDEGSCNLECELQSNQDCSLSSVLLQIYNQDSNEWENVDSDSTTAEGTDFTLSGNIANLTNYKTGDKTISCRVYQQNV